MPLIGIGIGGGGAGFVLGAPQNVFGGIDTTRALAENERDLYALDNPTWLGGYDGDSNLNIILIWKDSGSIYAEYQVRKENAWAKNASAVALKGDKGDQGVQGIQGEVGAKIIDAQFNANDIDFLLDDSTKATLVDAVLTLKGEKGENLLFQFSEDGVSGWVDEATYRLNPDIYYFWRWSTDGGTTWEVPTRFKGESAPNMILQFTDTIGGTWVDEETYALNPDAYNYWRWSVDGGTTWSPDGVRVRASVEDLPAGWGWFSNLDGDLLLKKDGETILTVGVEELKSKRLNAINSEIKFGSSKTMYDTGENVVIVNRADNVAYHSVWQSAEGDWKAKVRIKGDEVIRYNADVFRTADETSEINYSNTFNLTHSKRISAFYVKATQGYLNCKLLILKNNIVEVTLEGFDLVEGENKIVFADIGESLPFIDLNGGNNYSISISDENGLSVQSRAFSDDITSSWWAIDGYKYSDKEIIDESKLGEGLSYTDKVSVTPATNANIGGVKVGTGLGVMADGTLYSTVSGAVVTEVADQAERLSLPQIAQSYICIQRDANLTYFLDANTDPSVNGNWKTDGLENTSVLGFKGVKDSDPRTGVVNAEKGDYTSAEITYEDVTASKKYTLGVDDGVVTFTNDTDALDTFDLVTSTTYEADITDPVDGLKKKVADLESDKGLQGIFAYDETKVYNTGEPIFDNNKVKIAKQDGITGAYDENLWDIAVGRNDTEASTYTNGDYTTIVEQDNLGDFRVTIDNTSGTPSQSIFNLSQDRGRFNLPSKTALEDANANDVLTKEEIESLVGDSILTFSPTGVYEIGDIVQDAFGIQYQAKVALDGTVTPLTLPEYTLDEDDNWRILNRKPNEKATAYVSLGSKDSVNYGIETYVKNEGLLHKAQANAIRGTDNETNSVTLSLDPMRNRASLDTVGTPFADNTLLNSDLITYSDFLQESGKVKAFDSSAKYKTSDVVQDSKGIQYQANQDLDGTTTPLTLPNYEVGGDDNWRILNRIPNDKALAYTTLLLKPNQDGISELHTYRARHFKTSEGYSALQTLSGRGGTLDNPNLTDTTRIFMDGDRKRATLQVTGTEFTQDAIADDDILTKADGDSLYVNTPYVSVDVDTSTPDGGYIPLSGSERIKKRGFNFSDMTATIDAVETTFTDAKATATVAGEYEIILQGLVKMDGTDNNPISIVLNRIVSGSTTEIRVHQARVYTDATVSYKNATLSTGVTLNVGDSIVFKLSGGELYGSGGDYTSVCMRYICPPMT